MNAVKRRVKIAGTGCYVPEKILANADLEKTVDTTDEWIFSRSGIKTRHIANHDQATSDLCIEAARRALRSARVEPTDVDLILTTTNTPDTSFPLRQRKKLKPGTILLLDAFGAGFTWAAVAYRW